MLRFTVVSESPPAKKQSSRPAGSDPGRRGLGSNPAAPAAVANPYRPVFPDAQVVERAGQSPRAAAQGRAQKESVRPALLSWQAMPAKDQKDSPVFPGFPAMTWIELTLATMWPLTSNANGAGRDKASLRGPPARGCQCEADVRSRRCGDPPGRFAWYRGGWSSQP
jgi:hypothetical protein